MSATKSREQGNIQASIECHPETWLTCSRKVSANVTATATATTRAQATATAKAQATATATATAPSNGLLGALSLQAAHWKETSLPALLHKVLCKIPPSCH